MKNNDENLTSQETVEHILASVNDQEAEVLKKKQVKQNIAEQRLFVALDVEMQKLFSPALVQ